MLYSQKQTKGNGRETSYYEMKHYHHDCPEKLTTHVSAQWLPWSHRLDDHQLVQGPFGSAPREGGAIFFFSAPSICLSTKRALEPPAEARDEAGRLVRLWMTDQNGD